MRFYMLSNIKINRLMENFRLNSISKASISPYCNKSKCQQLLAFDIYE